MRSFLIKNLAMLCVGLMFGIPSPLRAQAPSFDCSRAASAVEHTICADAAMAATDARLNTAYKAALAVSDADRDVVREEQRDWLRHRDKDCRPTATVRRTPDTTFLRCLAKAYEQRLEQLSPTPEESASCDPIAVALRAAEAVDVSTWDRVADIAAAVPGSALRLDDRATSGYVLESTYGGSLHCQVPRLLHVSAGRKTEVSLPENMFSVGEGYCGADKIRLASVNGIPGLLEEWDIPDVRRDVRMIQLRQLRMGARWSNDCKIAVLLRPTYQVAVASCLGGSCGALTDLVRQYSEARHGLLGEQKLPAEVDLPPDQRAKYADLIGIASRDGQVSSMEVPFFGDRIAVTSNPPWCSLSFDGLGGSLFPVVSGDEVMIGKIGNDGFGLGAHSGGPNDAIAIYRLASGRLEPVGGFCVVVGHQSISSVTAD